MKKYGHAVWAALAFVALAAGYFWGLHRQTQVSPAHHGRHPARVEFALPDLRGHVRHLTHWPAKLYLVNFWAPWCPPCRDEIPLLKAAAVNYRNQGLVVVGIALDHGAAVQEYVTTHDIRYPVLLGGEQGLYMLNKYGDLQGAIPFSLFVTPKGRIIGGQLGAFTGRQLNADIAGILKKG